MILTEKVEGDGIPNDNKYVTHPMVGVQDASLQILIRPRVDSGEHIYVPG